MKEVRGKYLLQQYVFLSNFSSVGWLRFQSSGVGLCHPTVLCTSIDRRGSEWEHWPSPPGALLRLLHHTFPVWKGCGVTGSSQEGTCMWHIITCTWKYQFVCANLCVCVCVFSFVCVHEQSTIRPWSCVWPRTWPSRRSWRREWL